MKSPTDRLRRLRLLPDPLLTCSALERREADIDDTTPHAGASPQQAEADAARKDAATSWLARKAAEEDGTAALLDGLEKLQRRARSLEKLVADKNTEAQELKRELARSTATLERQLSRARQQEAVAQSKARQAMGMKAASKMMWSRIGWAFDRMQEAAAQSKARQAMGMKAASKMMRSRTARAFDRMQEAVETGQSQSAAAQGAARRWLRRVVADMHARWAGHVASLRQQAAVAAAAAEAENRAAAAEFFSQQAAQERARERAIEDDRERHRTSQRAELEARVAAGQEQRHALAQAHTAQVRSLLQAADVRVQVCQSVERLYPRT